MSLRAVASGTLAVVACAAAATLAIVVALWLFRLPGRLHVRGFRHYLHASRRAHYRDRGLDPTWRLLRQQTADEAIQLVVGKPTALRKSPRGTIDLVRRVESALSYPETLADVVDESHKEERRQLRADLLALAGRLQWSWPWHLLSYVVFATAAIALLLRQAMTVGDDLRPTWVSAVLSAVIAYVVVYGGFGRRRDKKSPEPFVPPPAQARPMEEETLGRPHEPIRALTFAGGGFDTVMDLGVIHALVVIQGRAPDAAVGLSAGAIHAAALAEVLQAGETAERQLLAQQGKQTWHDLTEPERVALQKTRILARVKRLREFLEAAQRAPERLLDAVLPDAYQIDVGRPLHPLQQPRLAPEEREKRRQYVVARAGLARLYNDLLNVPLSVGAITKLTRRILGLRGAMEISSRVRRWAVAITECMSLWLLLGFNLLPAATLMPIGMRAFLQHKETPSETAGTLIFRSRLRQGLSRYLAYSLWLVCLTVLWLSISVSAFPVLLPVFLVVIGVIVVRAAIRGWDPTSRGVLADGIQGLISWTGLIAIYATLIALVASGVAQTAGPNAPALPSSFSRALSFWLVNVGISGAIAVILWLSYVWTRSNPRSYIERLLGSYNLGNAIFEDHGLRTFLLELFDPSFYFRPSMDEAVEASLDNQVHCKVNPDLPRPSPKMVSYYHCTDRLPNERIHLGLGVADAEQGRLSVVPGDVPVVEGLMAATAVTPWLPPVELTVTSPLDHPRQGLFIDGTNVSPEPTHALLRLLRERRRADAGAVYIYSVTPFPLSNPEAGLSAHTGGPNRNEYLNLIDIVRRAMRLQRFRDASLARRLTELVTAAIPADQDCVSPNDVTIFRTAIIPIELDYDADVNARLYGTAKQERRRIVDETIADGCRATLQAIIDRPDTETVKCREAVARHLANAGVSSQVAGIAVPGSETVSGPGLSEVCRNCSLNRREQLPADAQRLRFPRGQEAPPPWPHERRDLDATPSRPYRPLITPRSVNDEVMAGWKEKLLTRADGCKTWPRASRAGTNSVARPTVSFLFSGGVFRGVYQIGVLNGLNELGLQPDVIAGASVGSITAAMIAQAFSIHDAELRHTRIVRIAAAYLAVDRIILTDRFADFVRNLTIRAAETRFSIRQLDRVFRKYDYPTLREFERNARRVVAGIERLIYISPYQLNEIIRAFRERNSPRISALLTDSVQHFLDRMQIGEEALGAEPLRDLIENYVTPGAAARDDVFTIDDLRSQHQIQFLATTTNLTRGRLEVLGARPASPENPAPRLEEALLASSAFPGVFRPRWSWELFSASAPVEQYIDGGVMDNLPLEAVGQFLGCAAKLELIHSYPKTPHLIVGASLEVQAPSFALAFTRRRLQRSWIRLARRAGQLGYNNKLDNYEATENTLRAIHAHVAGVPPAAAGEDSTVGIQVVSVKPNWLCGTFAFHPMLGFRRSQQAKSIAHGCATTLLRFAQFNENQEATREWLADWGIGGPALPQVRSWNAAFEGLPLKKDAIAQGGCWLRDRPCPFSEQTLKSATPALSTTVVREVSQIHRFCSVPATHLRRL